MKGVMKPERTDTVTAALRIEVSGDVEREPSGSAGRVMKKRSVHVDMISFVRCNYSGAPMIAGTATHQLSTPPYHSLPASQRPRELPASASDLK